MDEKEFNYINVIPFIDIMLVLLAIVLTTSTFIVRGAIPLELPRASDHNDGALKTLQIEIDKKEIIYINSQPVALSALKDIMLRHRPDTPVLIRADRDIALQAFVNVIDLVKSMGFRKVSLQTEHKQ